MGIDKMSIAANYHNQAVQATQINKVNVQTSSDTAAKEMTAAQQQPFLLSLIMN